MYLCSCHLALCSSLFLLIHTTFSSQTFTDSTTKEKLEVKRHQQQCTSIIIHSSPSFFCIFLYKPFSIFSLLNLLRKQSLDKKKKKCFGYIYIWLLCHLAHVFIDH